MTWEDIYKLFIKKNKMLKKEVSDYRPHDNSEIAVWLKNGVRIIVSYDQEKHDVDIVSIDVLYQ